MKKYILIAGCVLVVLGGLLVKLHGQARYDAGYADCVAQNNKNQVEAVNDSQKKMEKIQRETHFMSDTDVDAELRSLGIMRTESDY